MKYLPFYIQAVAMLGMLTLLAYSHLDRNIFDVAFGFSFGIIVGVALTLIRFQKKHVDKYGLYD